MRTEEEYWKELTERINKKELYKMYPNAQLSFYVKYRRQDKATLDLCKGIDGILSKSSI